MRFSLLSKVLSSCQLVHLPSLKSGVGVWLALLVFFAVGDVWGQAPPAPSSSSTIGQTVTNPVTSSSTTVSNLMLDPAGTATAGTTAFVITADGYAFLVKPVGQIIYNQDVPPVGFVIVSENTTDKTVQVRLASDSSAPTATLAQQQLNTSLQAEFLGADTPGFPTAPVSVTGASGVRIVRTGDSGSKGRNGALFVPPRSGGNGDTGPAVSYTNIININTSNQIGIEAGSIGGNGGNGGNSYASFWSGRDGGDGGAGGPVTVINSAGFQVATTGDNMHGIFAYSRSGRAGNGGSGFAAPGGGTGGHSADGGTVSVTNNGTIITTGNGAFGIYGLSVSNNGGNGGDTWGLVGQSGAGNYGGNGGLVTITNNAGGVISTSGTQAHGILAQSIGGSGGSSGISGNLLVSLNGAPDNGGNGGIVEVTNNGRIQTTGDKARGIFAQSIGGGGGAGGTSGGLIALGGSGSNGGSGGAVTVTNGATGQIFTQGIEADGIMAQSIGGSGGSGSDAFGLVSVGGGGSRAGNGAAVTVTNLGRISTEGDKARGIVAQSIGGGGGDGGSSGGLVSVGGRGSVASSGGTVSVTNGGHISTLGIEARGILAQSIGGGGGNGGTAGSVGVFTGLAIGGSGGAGGPGGQVTVQLQGESATTASTIQTRGDRSAGLFAQSVGGGGGSGGGAIQVSVGYGVGASFAVGGRGGVAGDGGDVTMTKGIGNSIVQTSGVDSVGVSLQSVGGGGGTGGLAVAVAVSGGPASGSFAMGIGGDGGAGGLGGDVTVGAFNSSNVMTTRGFNGSITTNGARSVGFLAQSVGGGGGNGGLGVGAAGAGSAVFSGSISLGLGGAGAGGGAGGLVRVGTGGDITTNNENSTAMVVQSVGGGGGNGGGSVAASLAASGGGAGTFGLSIGGSGGLGSAGGTVVLDTGSGVINTLGNNSLGIVAQSVGGGGGNGGYSISPSLAVGGIGAGAVNVGLGGTGGGGGHGGRVTANLLSDVTTRGMNASGIVVQSVGGGGGNGGYNVSVAASFGGNGSGAVGIGLGGAGGAGGLGGIVEATSRGAINTYGPNSTGFVAQSIGGGGGNGGFSVGVAGSGAGIGSGAVALAIGGSGGSGNHANNVTAVVDGEIRTRGDASGGAMAQSIGGGGGNGGFTVNVAGSGAATGSGAVSVGIGGNGGSAGNAGEAQIEVRRAILTERSWSSAVTAQSIGGGGGNGGFNVSVAGSGAGTGSGAVSVGLGGRGAAGGDAAKAKATVTADLETQGDKSTGLLVQSIGGGGGNGGFNVSVAGSGAPVGSGGVSVGLGGNGGGAGNGGLAEASSTGKITTSGNQSNAFVVQSIGGGGGNGGFNVSTGLSGAGTGSGAISVGLGGAGGGGGNAGNVIANASGAILTSGVESAGLVAQSIGGGGGNGGFNVSVAGSGAGTGSGSVGVGLGGRGAAGGTGGNVGLTVTNNVTTTGLANAPGILAQSIGGGGGNGAFDVSAALSGFSNNSGAVGVSIGGGGGNGGDSGIITSSITGDVTTRGINSGGVLLQSVGGGGGNGGMSVAGALSFASTGSGAVSVGIGGAGGNGGDSSSVTGTFTGDISTLGKDSYGFAAQSIGGGGGNGGMSISGTISGSKSGAGAVAFGLGGFGGGGGNAALVDHTLNGYVETQGEHSTGVLAQSVGGGGGNGGVNITGSITFAKSESNSLAIGIGGFGGGGGTAGNVINNVNGGVVTSGRGSDGIVSQSLGGGGGNGGMNITGTLNLSKEDGGTLGLGVGGFGGNGGGAGTVTSIIRTTSANPDIATTRDNSSAVVAQSIGGGGGNGGMNIAGAVNLTTQDGAAMGLGFGGFGGGSGIGNRVDLDVNGNVTTYGNLSHGLVAQSIGGGGGNGGMNVTGSIAGTDGTPGAATAAVAFGVGGFGGGGGNAGIVNVDYSGTIYTHPGIYTPPAGGNPANFVPLDGEGSHGLVAQSIGGGGGNGAINVSGAFSYQNGKGDAYGIIAGVGGFGGNAGSGSDVTVDVIGGNSITAYGAGHSAILAQSIGGAGGAGGMNVSGGITSDSSLLVGVGGFGANAGTSGKVVVNAATNVFTGALDSKKFNSAGVMAQSIGGGGGNGGLNVNGGLTLDKSASVPSVNLGIGGFGGAGARSGDVEVDLTGNAIVAGDWVHGVMAQSIAGGGGNGGINAGGQFNFADSENSGGRTDISVIAGVGGNAGSGANAGDVDLIQNGTVTTIGQHARGIIAQSIGGGGGQGGMNLTAVYATNSSPITVGVGGSGGGGGDAGSVTVTRGNGLLSTGKITTDGYGSHGIEASSIGGGGGDAGMNFNVGFSKVGEDNANPGMAANFIIGGNGATAGNAAASTVTNFSAIETKQDRAYGILAQSIGGGGGNGSFNIGVTYAGAAKDPTGSGDEKLHTPNKNMAFSLAVGGATGNGGDGGRVIVDQTGNVTTRGKDAIGILAQSVGGGGGNAGLDIAYVKADGGKGSVTIGRTGGTGGIGGDVDLNFIGVLNTTGDGAFGLLAQSIGNGGGNSSSTTISGEVPSTQNSVGQNRSQSASLAIGLDGGVGGRGGIVILNSSGAITTRGKRAHAVFAQSLGGGGGNGGKANTFGVSAAIMAVTLGGTGGSGGLGGDVTLTNRAVVETFGEEAVALLAQSIGGGGGDGGSAYSGGLKSGDSGVTMGIGGTGGSGMNAGIVTLVNHDIVVTHGLGAHAVLAQSIGGGGGDGGMAVSMILGLNEASPLSNSSTRVAINVGGNGGTGGDGGAVNVTNHSGIGTGAGAAVGIFAQSIGGGGGNGKSVLSSALSGMESNNFSVSVGGTGGTGGAGGTVTVKNELVSSPNSVRIITLGDKAHGILAMSIGGGGGTGSNASTFNSASKIPVKNTEATTANYVGIALGGQGGSGGLGGFVDVLNAGSIDTYGKEAHGIVAQSIGGGGGQGGMAVSGDLAFGSEKNPANGKTFEVAIGGNGGSGNAGEDVLVTNTGTIHVRGERSNGIYAQSIGGGGGDGGIAAAFSRNLLTNPKSDLVKSLSSFALGGRGGSGADSGTVTVDHTGSITVGGDNSYGIFAQSVSGGGGNAAMSISSPVWMASNFLLNTILGGGSNGTAGSAIINASGTISVTGKNSLAQFSQSVNGGGGNAYQFLDFSEQAANLGNNGLPLPGSAGAVDVALGFVESTIQLGADTASSLGASLVDATQLGSLFGSGENSGGGLLQSVGGGGGRNVQEVRLADGSQVSLTVALGGRNVNDSNGNTVTFNQTGDTGTTGDQSIAQVLQSIGGGGGMQIISVRTEPPPVTVASFAAPAPFAVFALPPPPPPSVILEGGDAVINSHGAAVNSTITGALISTSGDRSTALVSQSIGGGGGLTLVTGLSAVDVSLGGKNGSSGNGGTIIVNHTRAVSTNGTLSNGILLQSIGGGGGAVFTDLLPPSLTVTPNTTNTGNGGNVSLVQTGDVLLQGPRSTGIILQSIGGGGGLVDDLFAGNAGGTGTSGTVELTLNGSLLATGAQGSGVFLQSAATGAQGAITFTFASGKSITAGTGGTAVAFAGGAANLFTNNGSIGGADGITARAFTGTNGNDVLNNNGTVTGNLDFGSGANAFNNNASGWVNLGPQFLLGAPGNLFTNDGVLLPGGFGLAQRTDMTGSFTQTANGITFGEIDFANYNIDQVYLNGAASLAGRWDITLLNPQLIRAVTTTQVLVNATGGVTNNGLQLTTPPSQVVTYQLLFPDANNAVLSYDVNFSTNNGYGRNLVEVGNYINRIQNAGSSPALADTIIRLLYEPTVEGYRDLLSQLGPDFYAEQQAEFIRGGLRFAETMLSSSGWRIPDGKRRHWWFDFVSSDTFHDDFEDYKAVRHQTIGIATGFEQQFADSWSAGIAVNLEDNSADGYGHRWNASGSSQRIGASIRGDLGLFEISGVVSYGWNQMSSSRQGDGTSLQDEVNTAVLTDVDRRLENFNAMLRFARQFQKGRFFFRPMFDVGYTRLMAKGATEVGSGPTSLILHRYTEDHGWFRPAAEFGADFRLSDFTRLRLIASASYLRFANAEDTNAQASFLGAPGGVSPMDVPVSIGSMTRLSLGAYLLLRGDLSIGLQYTKAFGGQYDMDIFNLRFSKSF